VIGLILKEAFSFRSIGGGLFGYAIMLAMRQGCARGVFSNEAGLGSAPIAHAASSTKEPCEQAMWGVFEVFVDTIVICSITSLAILLSGVYTGDLASYSSKGAAAAAAFNTLLPGSIGGIIIQASLIFFALSTVLGWSYYGASCWEYLTHNKTVVMVYKVVFAFVCIIGAIGSGQLVWDISDTLNGLMAIPNLIALLLLSSVIISMTKEYFADKK
jgi:AGCS family alanine or glycine:cation symporter